MFVQLEFAFPFAAVFEVPFEFGDSDMAKSSLFVFQKVISIDTFDKNQGVKNCTLVARLTRE